MNGPSIVVSAAPERETGLDPSRLERLTGYMEQLVEGGHCPNAMTLVSRHGRIAYCKGTGLQNDGKKGSLSDSPVPLREDTIFRICKPPLRPHARPAHLRCSASSALLDGLMSVWSNA